MRTLTKAWTRTEQDVRQDSCQTEPLILVFVSSELRPSCSSSNPAEMIVALETVSGVTTKNGRNQHEFLLRGQSEPIPDPE